MLDVHPPHHATHGWRDFFIHIATICVGLLIAVGLEQTVEEVCEGNIPYFDQHLHWLLETKAAVDQFRANRNRAAATLPSEPPLAPGTFKDRGFQITTWTSAKTTGLLGLLSQEQAAPFSRAYDMEDQADR